MIEAPLFGRLGLAALDRLGGRMAVARNELPLCDEHLRAGQKRLLAHLIIVVPEQRHDDGAHALCIEDAAGASREGGEEGAT